MNTKEINKINELINKWNEQTEEYKLLSEKISKNEQFTSYIFFRLCWECREIVKDLKTILSKEE